MLYLTSILLFSLFYLEIVSFNPWINEEYSKFPTQCKDVEGYFRMPSERGFACKKSCNTCFDCYCDVNGRLHPGGACTRKGCGYQTNFLQSNELNDDSKCLDINGIQRQFGEGGFSCYKDCNICLDCFCSPHGKLVHSNTCTKKLCPQQNKNKSNCKDSRGKRRFPGERNFSCQKDCNICGECSCSKNGQLIHGNLCTRKLCSNLLQRGCKDFKGRIRHPGELFSCKKGCNTCSKCSCTSSGKLIYGKECSKMACLENQHLSEDYCYDAYGEKKWPKDGKFACKKNCNTCTGCQCNYGGVLKIGGRCTRMACLSNECLDISGLIRKPGDRNFSCKKNCNTCIDCGCSRDGKLVFGSKCTLQACL